jgi:hypothetical protein
MTNHIKFVTEQSSKLSDIIMEMSYDFLDADRVFAVSDDEDVHSFVVLADDVHLLLSKIVEKINSNGELK